MLTKKERDVQLTYDQAAAILRLPAKLVYDLTNKGFLMSHYTDGGMRIPQQSVLHFAERYEIKL